MTFEGFDAAPLIEAGGFSPDMFAMAHTASAADAGTLDAALREAARAEMFVADLWIGHGDARGLRSFERAGLEAGTSGRALAPLLDDAVLELPGGKNGPPRAALSEPAPKPDPKEEEEITVKGTRPKTYDDDGLDGVPSGDVGGGEDQPGGGPTGGETSPKKVADHTQDCGTDDGAAVQIAKHVMGTPPGAGPPDPFKTPGGFDWTQVEFGAVIIRNADGTYGALNDAIYSNETSFATLPSPVGSDARGLWHNHYGRDGTDPAIDRYPSSYPDGRGDWDALQRLHDAVAPNDPSFDPSLWIMGPDGITREFKLSERAYYESLTPEQMKASEGLNGKERTQSCG